ncbi:hypothetical protein BC828DRAFT_437178 [Blastocladiella britannica]|nr:hypothetical protein BC828DRAFT_437178 [Blastocladiella britannica]
MSTSPTRGGAATATAATPTNSAAASAARQLAAVTATASAEVQQALADYAVGRVLGKGKFSQVYLVTSRTSGRKFAFKVLSKVDHRPRVMAKLRREIEILHALRDAKVYIPCAAAAPTEATAMAASAHRRGHGHGGGRRPRLPRVDSAGSGSGSVVPGNWPSIPLDEDLAIASSRRQHHSESLATLHEQTHMCASDASENGDNDSDESECSDDDDDDSVEPATLRGHPNLVTLHQAFETPSSTILLLEYIAGINLHDFVFESIRLSEGVARGLFRQLVSATSFCHARGVVHRDLKMGNVMLILAQPPTPVYSPPPQASSSMTLSGGSSHHLPSDNMQQQQQQPPHSPRRGSEPAVQYNGGAGSSSANGRSPATPRHWPRRLELTRSYRLKFRSAIVASPVGEDQYEMVRDPCSGRSWMEQEIAESGGWLVKLVDFGLGSSFDPQEYRHTAVGSPGYFSPEIALGAEYVGPEVDVWSLGVVLFEMTTGMHPFSAKDLPTLKEIVVRGRFAVPPHVSPDLRRTFHRMMVTDPRRRRNLHVLDHDAWTNAGYGAHAPAAYSDPPEDALVAAGVPDLTDGTVVMVDDGVLLAEAEGLVASPPAVAGTLGAPTSTDRRRSLSSPATAVDAIAAGYGRPRAGTARTAPGSATAAAAVAAAGPWVGGTASESAPGFYGAADDEMTVRRHELARRLRTFNASVPALAQYGISVPNGGQRAYHGVPAASSPSRGASSGDTGVVRRSHSRSRSSGSTARRTSVVETAALMMAGGVAPTFDDPDTVAAHHAAARVGAGDSFAQHAAPATPATATGGRRCTGTASPDSRVGGGRARRRTHLAAGTAHAFWRCCHTSAPATAINTSSTVRGTNRRSARDHGRRSRSNGRRACRRRRHASAAAPGVL